MALASASVQAAASVRVLCLGSGNHLQIEQIQVSALYLESDHAQTHHQKSAPVASNARDDKQEPSSQGTSGVDLVVADEWTGAHNFQQPTPKDDRQADRLFFKSQNAFQPPVLRRHLRKSPPRNFRPPNRASLFDRLLL